MANTPRSQRVSDEVRAEMARQRRTVVEMADAIGITESTLRRRLHGHSAFDLDELHAVADFLNITVTELVGRSDETGVIA